MEKAIEIVAGIYVGIYLLFIIFSILYTRRSGIIKGKMLLYLKEHYPEKWKEINQSSFNKLRFIFLKYDIELPEIKEMKEKVEKAYKLHKKGWTLFLIGTIWLLAPVILICLHHWFLAK